MKHKITIVTVVEYEVVPENYPADLGDEGRLALELENVSENLAETINSVDAISTITGEYYE